MKSVNEYILKVASRCNLNCSYCYMYNKGDLTYKKQPKLMSDAVVDALIERVRRHVTIHKPDNIDFAFHGGEPLLAPPSFYINFVSKATGILSNFTNVHFALQTNGVLLNEEWARLFVDLNIHIGTSIDGDQQSHDENRVYHSGKGSYQDVTAGLQVLNKYMPTATISVINVRQDPVRFYQSIKQLGVIRLSILLPDSTYENPEPGHDYHQDSEVATYGDWLVKLYDAWRNDKDSNRPGIPFFRNILSILL